MLKPVTMETGSVFDKLKSLARRLDQGVIDIQEKISNPKPDSDIASANAYQHLKNTKKEVLILKDQARDTLGALQVSNARMEKLLYLLPQVIKLQKQSLSSIEEHLQQYGYVKRETNQRVDKDNPEEITPESKDCESADEDEENDGTYTISAGEVKQENPPPNQLKPSECKTPRLEDFGISDYTLNLIKKGSAYTPKGPTVDSHVAQPQYNPGFRDEPPTPASFKHDGLMVTPSLIGGRSILEQTPDCARSVWGIPHLRFMEDSPAPYNAAYSTEKPKGVYPDHSGSPVPPVFMSGAKQINRNISQVEAVKKTTVTEDTDSPIPPVLMTPGAKQITKNISGDRNKPNEKTENESPVVPILLTPGVKQIQKTITEPKPSIPLSVTSWDEEPEMPEFTRSLEDITRLTQSFRLNHSSMSAQQPPEPPVTRSQRFNDADTPPLPELLSTRLAQMSSLPKTPTSSVSSNPTNKDDTVSSTVLSVTKGNTPPPPVLLGKYSFMTKSQENVPPYGQ